ncbi:MAG: TolC family protein [Treponema sp.]|nr:TolC family protein [Treponema sp.]
MLENNPDLLKLEQECEQAKLDLRDAKAGLGPTVDLQVSGTYMLKPPVEAIYLNVDELLNSIQWPSGIKPLSSGQHVKIYDGMENTLYNFQLSVMQPIFTWGKLHSAVELYALVAEIKETQMMSQQRQIETEMETRLIALNYLKEILKILDEEKEYASKLVETSENAERSGMLLHQDVVEARIQTKELEIAQQDVAEQINNQLLELKRATGVEDLALEKIDYTFAEADLLEILGMEQSLAEEKALSENQLSLIMLTKLKEVNALAEKISKAYVNWKPDVALQMSAGYGGSRIPFVEPNWRRKDAYSANFSVGLKTTVWDGGKKLNDVSRKMSESKVGEVNKIEARSTIRQSLNSQWNAAEVCSMKIEYQDLKIEAADSKIKQQETIFQSGYGSETDVLSAKIERCNHQIEKIRQQLSRATACMVIKHLVGDF